MLYWLERGQVAGVSLLRWLWIGGLLLVLLLPLMIPGGLWASGAIGIALAVLSIAHRLGSRHAFVRFDAETMPVVRPEPLPAAEKLPVHATGPLEVDGRVRTFVWLPGFYRTFATREHALLCQCREQRVLGIGHWREAETGLWYGFFKPEHVRALRWGKLKLGGEQRRAIAIEHQPEANSGLRKRRGVETLYVACPDDSTALRILADLAVEHPAELALVAQLAR